MMRPIVLDCPGCQGSGLCTTCRGGSINEIGYSCWECGATHRCGDCDGTGLYDTDKLKTTEVTR